MMSLDDAVRILDLIKKIGEKRYQGDGMYPYASYEYNGSYSQLYIKAEPNKWHFFTEEEFIGKIGKGYRPLSEGIKLLEELTND